MKRGTCPRLENQDSRALRLLGRAGGDFSD